MTLQQAITEIRAKLQQKGILNVIEEQYDLDEAIKTVYDGMCGKPDTDLFVKVTYEIYLNDLLEGDSENICSC